MDACRTNNVANHPHKRLNHNFTLCRPRFGKPHSANHGPQIKAMAKTWNENVDSISTRNSVYGGMSIWNPKCSKKIRIDKRSNKAEPETKVEFVGRELNVMHIHLQGKGLHIWVPKMEPKDGNNNIYLWPLNKQTKIHMTRVEKLTCQHGESGNKVSNDKQFLLLSKTTTF